MKHPFIIYLIICNAIVFIGNAINSTTKPVERLLPLLTTIFSVFGLIYWCW